MQREQPEKCAQDVLAFGRPRDGFDVQRMPGKQRRDKRAAPERAGRLRKNKNSSSVLAM